VYSGLESGKEGLKEAALQASAAASSGAQSARESASYAGQKIYTGGAVAGQAMKTKLDETGVSDAARRAADSVVTNAKYAGSVVNEKIEANPTLANARKQTTQRMGAAAAYVGSWVGWGSGDAAAANEEQNQEEEKQNGNDSFEESKEESQP